MIGSGGSASSQLNLNAISASPGVTWDVEAFSTGDQRARFSMGLLSNDGGDPDADLLLGGSGGVSWFLAHPTVSDGASAVAYKLATYNTLANASARLLSVQNPLGTEKVGFLANGNVTIPGTLNVGALFATNVPVNLTYTTTNLLLNAESGSTFRAFLTNNFGIRLTNGFDGQEVILECYQDSVGFRTGVLVNNTGGTQTNLLKSGSDIAGMALSTNGVTKDILKFKFTAAFGGKTNQWDLIGNLRGY
jgi:hypothetical protein